ncbi:transposase (plasmid) [Streptomyces sp. BHT-5-2]|nr:transposase [Streptomyces sp. BHT-5-2]
MRIRRSAGLVRPGLGARACPEHLRGQFEGVVWRFRTGSQWREMPAEFGAWSTVYDRFAQWRDAGVFQALMEGMIGEAEPRTSRSVSGQRRFHDRARPPRCGGYAGERGGAGRTGGGRAGKGGARKGQNEQAAAGEDGNDAEWAGRRRLRCRRRHG